MSRKLRGLFLNTEKDVCSIYESGKMCFNALCESEEYSLDYCEVGVKNRNVSLGYDFYVFNYHFTQMKWLDTEAIKKWPGFKATIVLEMSQNSPFDCVSPDDFDAYLVLDPTCRHFLKNVYAFPRPLETSQTPVAANMPNEVPVIGTFGLSYADKGFDEVVKAANKEFDAAIVRINVPESKNSGKQDVLDFTAKLPGMKLKDGIKVELSSHYFDKEELIAWCAQNTLNVFLYNRRIGNGLSATTDQAIASGAPLAISTNPTFRHVHSYIKPYPYLSLRDAIETTAPIVKKIQDDWSKRRFAMHFQDVLTENNVQPRAGKLDDFPKAKLPVIRGFSRAVGKIFSRRGLALLVPPILPKVARKTLRAFGRKFPVSGNISAAPPFVHQALLSNSQFQEDLLIDLLLGRKNSGTYVDVGANDPSYNSNTHRFYSRGWRGINIAPDKAAYKKMKKDRAFDINLNMAISNESGGPDGISLAKVLETHLAGRHIDFLSVTANGRDLDVLTSNDWDKYRPTLVMVDSSSSFREITMLLERNAYLYVFNSHAKALFVDKMSADPGLQENISWSS